MSKKIMIMLLVILVLLPSLVFAQDEIINDGLNKAISEYKDEIAFISNLMIAFAGLLSVLIFIIHFIRLGGYHTHSMMRKKVIQDLMVSAVCTAIIGGFGLLFRIYLEVFIL